MGIRLQGKTMAEKRAFIKDLRTVFTYTTKRAKAKRATAGHSKFKGIVTRRGERWVQRAIRRGVSQADLDDADARLGVLKVASRGKQKRIDTEVTHHGTHATTPKRVKKVLERATQKKIVLNLAQVRRLTEPKRAQWKKEQATKRASNKACWAKMLKDCTNEKGERMMCDGQTWEQFSQGKEFPMTKNRFHFYGL